MSRTPKIPGIPLPSDPQFGNRVREALQTLLGQRAGGDAVVTESRLKAALDALPKGGGATVQPLGRADVLKMLQGSITQDMLDEALQAQIAVEAEDEEELADQRVGDVEESAGSLGDAVGVLNGLVRDPRPANLMFAGPGGGADAAPGWRLLELGDLPEAARRRPVRLAFVGMPVGGQVFGVEVFEAARVFLAGLPGSVGRVVGANPAAAYTVALTIYNGAGVAQAAGSFSIDTAGAFAFSWASDYTAAVGDYLVMVGQAAPDAALSTFGATLMAWVG